MKPIDIYKALVSAPVLIFQALLLAFVCWPMANHWISYFWLLVFVAVLLGELLSKLFSPKKQTVSNNLRDESISESKSARFRFWIAMIVWIWFSLTLFGHFLTKFIGSIV